MTYNRACAKAKRLSESKKTDMFVVLDYAEEEVPVFEAATSFELDTFFLGCPISAHYFCGELQI